MNPPDGNVLEQLVPMPLQINSATSTISIHSATLYTALHPLLTKLESSTGGPQLGGSSRLFHVIPQSASVVIDHFAQLNEEHKIISIWMAAERVLEAGLVWAAYLISQNSTTLPGHRITSIMGTRIAMGPLIKVSTLLASFAARWKSGSVHANSWETLMDQLWDML